MIHLRFYFIFLLAFNLLSGESKKKVGKKDHRKTIFYHSLIPGLGQAKNKKWIKSLAIIGLEVAAVSNWSNNASIYNRFDNSPESYPLTKDTYLKKRNKYAWWIGILYFYSMIDAVVDGHFYEFKDIINSSIENDIDEEGNDEK